MRKTIVKEIDYYIEANEIFGFFHKEPMAVFLDSSLNNEYGQYSIIGLQPYLIVKEIENKLYVNDVEKEEAFETFMQSYLQENKEDNDTTLPIISGAIGYLSYDYGRKFENIKSQHQSKVTTPETIFCFYELYIIEDVHEKKLYITARNNDELLKMEIKLIDIHKRLKEKTKLNIDGKVGLEEKSPNIIANFTKDEYIEAIEKMKNYIVEGDIYVANMTQQFRIDSEKSPFDVFQYLRNHNPSPFGGYFNYEEFQVICASPERFIRIKDGWIETRPIKGTRKRGKNDEEDLALRKELEESDKDKSELLMIVDLERNDLNRVCIPGSVKVTQLFAIETYATVHHLVATVEGKLKCSLSFCDLLQALFPGGSITGAPKIRAMEIIDELEKDKRGLYTGSIGYIGLDGNMDFNIIIRTAVHQKEVYHLGTGGGVTYESDEKFEYEETLQKAQAMLEAVRKMNAATLNSWRI